MSKYKLINITTKQETLCDKITIDGFDYYMSDEEIKDVRPYKGKWHIEKDYILNKFPTYLTDLSECRIVIATNNPNIDIPKVENEVEELAYNHYKSNQHYTTRDAHHFGIGYNKSQETHPFSAEDMIEFGKFCSEYDYRLFGSKTHKELLQLWQEQQPKKVYYNE